MRTLNSVCGHHLTKGDFAALRRIAKLSDRPATDTQPLERTEARELGAAWLGDLAGDDPHALARWATRLDRLGNAALVRVTPCGFPAKRRWYRTFARMLDAAGPPRDAKRWLVRNGFCVARLTKLGRKVLTASAQDREAPPPLGDTAARVYEMLLALPPHRAMTASEIADTLPTPTDESTIRRNVIPALRPYGLEHVKRIGYRIAPDRRPPSSTPAESAD